MSREMAEVLRAQARVLLLLADAQEATPAPVPPAPTTDLLPLTGLGLYGLSVKQARHYIAAGALPAVRSGRRLLVARTDAESWLDSHRVRPKQLTAPAAEPLDEIDQVVARVLAGGRMHAIKGGKP